MTHQEAVSARFQPSPRDPNPTCRTELQYQQSMVIDQVRWEVYWCPTCGVEIVTLGAKPHWANHVMLQ